MELLILFAVLLVLAFPILSLVALARSGKGARALEELEGLREEMHGVKGRLAQQEEAQRLTQRALEAAEARLAALTARELPPEAMPRAEGAPAAVSTSRGSRLPWPCSC